MARTKLTLLQTKHRDELTTTISDIDKTTGRLLRTATKLANLRKRRKRLERTIAKEMAA